MATKPRFLLLVADGFHVETHDRTHDTENDPPLQTLLAPDTDQI